MTSQRYHLLLHPSDACLIKTCMAAFLGHTAADKSNTLGTPCNLMATILSLS